MEEKKIKGTRNKEVTKRKILDATARIVLRDGFNAVGINAVAKEAGVDKVMIYRYFNDITGLLKAFVTEKDYWLIIPDNVPKNLESVSIEDLKMLSVGIFTDLLKNLLQNKEMQELLLWELIGKNEVSAKTTALREEQGLTIMRQFEVAINAKNFDMEAFSAVIVAGIYFLVLRSKTVDVFNGVPINNEEGWKRIENTVELITSVMFNELTKGKNPGNSKNI
jgi:AcrR family transcriptional regulator